MRMAARRMLGEAGPGVLTADLAACNACDTAGAMADRIACPALVLIGGADRMTPPAAGTALAARFAGARTVAVAACGHMAMAEAPRAVHTAIAGFVATLPADGAATTVRETHA
ncbi:MAG: alpha/beta fold hydrolase [Alphaproteobacteria bacterium]